MICKRMKEKIKIIIEHYEKLYKLLKRWKRFVKFIKNIENISALFDEVMILIKDKDDDLDL